MNSKLPVSVLLLIACLGLCSCSEAPERVLIKDVIRAYGGEKALRSIQGYRMTGRQLAVQEGKVIDVARWFGRPDRLHLELAYPDRHETRYTDGSEGWAGPSAASLESAHPLKLQAMRLQTARLDLPIRLMDSGNLVEALPADDRGRFVLRLPVGEDLLLDYHIDPGTFRITTMTMWMPGPPAMEFSADYDQFHEIEGVLIPFREITYAGKTVTSRFQVTDFKWNPNGLEAALTPQSSPVPKDTY